MRLPTFSRVPIAMECPGSIALPQARAARTEEADRGVGRHSFVERCINLGRKAALASAHPLHLAELERMDIAGLLRFFDGCAPVRSEMAYAYNWVDDTARQLGQGIERAYERHGADPERDICGTLDLEARHLLKSGDLLIADMKGPGRAKPWQLRVQALAAARAAEGVERVWCVFAHAQEDGGWFWANPMKLEALDLDVIAHEVRLMAGRCLEARDLVRGHLLPDVAEGDWCQWCDAWRNCPAKNAQIVALATTGKAELAELHRRVFDMEGPELAEAYARFRFLSQPMEALGKAFKERALLEPIDAGGGKLYGPQEGNEYIDVEIARAVLTKQFNAATADAATKSTVNKKSIGEACGADADKALEMIRQAGGIKSGAPVVREYRPKIGGKR